MEKGLPPTILIILGITGDLSHRYLLPSLASLEKDHQLRGDFKILGVSRRKIGAKDVFSEATKILEKRTSFFQMDFGIEADYGKLKKHLLASDPQTQIIFYFAVPPDAVSEIIEHLGESGLNGPKVKLLLEKPFGKDLASAEKLVKRTAKFYKENQLYRIDHYLAKTAAQNISVFLNSNALFRKVWNRKFIEYIEIVVAESIGLEGRNEFYEETGALRDIVQSHLMQLAALVLMDPCPNPFDLGQIPQRRLAALKDLSVAPDLLESLIAGQYKGYRREVNNPTSDTETFVALKVVSKDPRWRGVPIYLGTGKKLDRRLTQVRINFKKDNAAEANTLILRIQPHEGIELDLWVKRPGYINELDKKTLSFSFAQHFEHIPNAYELVLVDAMRSDHSLFASSQEVLASWKVIQPVLDAWRSGDKNLRIYKPGSSMEQVLGVES